MFVLLKGHYNPPIDGLFFCFLLSKTRMNFKKSLLYFILFFSCSAQAQKVGLVLSGGGAKGLAHIGVLKALEENGIPIDYVVGTSMGGVIGGFYVAGYSPEEIEVIATKENFQDWVRGTLNKEYTYFYSKKEADASFLNVDLFVDSTLTTKLNTNIASDLALNYILAEFLAQASANANNNFDSLFVPYRAVASEVFTQTEEILKKGDLQKATRATMTVPLFYRPIKIDNKYMFDGGIYNNFPVDVVINEFNPDVVIGVNVSSKKFKEYPYKTDDKLLSESFSLVFTNKGDPSRLPDNGIYIEPNLQEFSSLEFHNVKRIIDSGYVKTMALMPEIKASIKSRRDKAQVTHKRSAFKKTIKPLKFGDISIIGCNTYQTKYIKKTFDKKRPLSINDIKSGYYKLVSENYFKNIIPNILYNKKTGLYDFEIQSVQKDFVKVSLGGNLATRNISQLFLGVEYDRFNRFLTNYNASFYAGRFYQSANLKARINFPSSNPFYIEPEFRINSWDYVNAKEIIFENQLNTIVNQTDRKFGLNIGMAAGTRGKTIVYGMYFSNTNKFSNTNELISTDTLDRQEFNGIRLGISYNRNSLNRKQYANSGDALSISIDYIDGNEKYEGGNTSLVNSYEQKNRRWFSARFATEKYFGTEKYHYGYYFETVISNQPFFANYLSTKINATAFYPFQDSKSIFLSNFRAHNYAVGGIRNVLSVNRYLDIRLEGYAFIPLREIIKQTNQEAQYSSSKISRVFAAASLSGVYNSQIGPISISFNYYDDPERKFGMLLHVGYLIYNKKSLE